MPGPIPSPIDTMPTPDRLTARVVDPADGRLHGYDVDRDLAAHYDFAEVVLLALTGEAPSAGQGRLFNRVLVHASLVDLGEAPVHAAHLARLCGAPPQGLTALAGLALAEQSRAQQAGDDRGRERPREPLEALLAEQGLEAPPEASRADLLLTALAACGLEQPWQQQLALTLARLPVLVAEAMASEPGDFGSYPMRLPPFRYGRGDA